MDEVVFDDGYKKPAAGEIVFDDKFFDSKQEILSTSMSASQETTKIAADQSQISTMYDGFGNKTETRCFNNHPRLQCVLLRTSADGKKQVFVYGQNGDVKDLPEVILDKTITASADELANAAGLFEIKQNRNLPTIVLNKPQNSPPLQPIPSYRLQVENQVSTEIEAMQQDEQATKKAPDNIIKGNASQPEEKRETMTQNRPPDEQQEN